MNIENWPIDRPQPYPRNARKLSRHAVGKVADSLREFGWRQPIVVDSKDVIICGHTQLLAAREIGLTSVPVHVAENLTPAQVRAYRLMDNRSNQEATWNDELLATELFDLKGLDFDLGLTGFNRGEIDTLRQLPNSCSSVIASKPPDQSCGTGSPDAWAVFQMDRSRTERFNREPEM